MSVIVISWSDHRIISPPDDQTVVTVSKAPGWSRGLSPFHLGPCPLWGGHASRTMENGWQASKVYPGHLEPDGTVGGTWLSWARTFWDSPAAVRYPMGRDARPLFSYWDGVRLSYVEARKAIYLPLYADAVLKSPAWIILRSKHERLAGEGKDLYLVDFDAYLHRDLGLSYSDVVNDPGRKCGHAFVLAMLLEDRESFDALAEEGRSLVARKALP